MYCTLGRYGTQNAKRTRSGFLSTVDQVPDFSAEGESERTAVLPWSVRVERTLLRVWGTRKGASRKS